MDTVRPSTGTATKIAADVQAGLRNARDVLDACLARVKSLDPEIGAFQVVDAEAARAEADALGTRADLADLPLAGVPVAIKDTIDVAGLPTRHGSAARSATPRPSDDLLVARPRRAGAVVVGKTRVPELAIWDFTESRAHGGTRNPRDLSQTPVVPPVVGRRRSRPDSRPSRWVSTAEVPCVSRLRTAAWSG